MYSINTKKNNKLELISHILCFCHASTLSRRYYYILLENYHRNRKCSNSPLLNVISIYFIFTGKAEPATVKSDPKGPEYDRFTLEWNARSLSQINRFKIEYKGLQDDTWNEEEVEAYPLPMAENIYTGTFMVQDLAPASVYMARVSSHNLYGYSEPGQVFQFATRGAG